MRAVKAHPIIGNGQPGGLGADLFKLDADNSCVPVREAVLDGVGNYLVADQCKRQAADFGGKVSIDYLPRGVKCSLKAPVGSVSAEADKLLQAH